MYLAKSTVFETTQITDIDRIKDSANQPRALFEWGLGSFQSLRHAKLSFSSGTLSYSQLKGRAVNMAGTVGPDLVVGLVLGGSACVEINGQEVSCTPPSGVIYLPGDVSYQWLDNLSNFTFRMPVVGDELIRLIGLSYQNLQRFPRRLETADALDFIRLAQFLATESDRNDRSDQVAVLSDALRARAIAYMKSLGLPRRQEDEHLMTIATRFAKVVAENQQATFTVSAFADKCLCSVRQLFRAVEAVIGTTPPEFVSRSRLHFGRSLILAAREEQDLQQVASRCGFSGWRRFATAYEMEYQEAPTETVRKKWSSLQGILDAAANSDASESYPPNTMPS